MINHIDNLESGLSVRDKLNQVIDLTVCSTDITVSLSPGDTLGKYVNGDVIPSQGKTFEEILKLLAIKDIAPTYTIPSIGLTKSATTQAEVGTSYSNTLTATFTQNDAGALTAIKIQKNGVDMTPNGSTSPFVKSDSGAYVLGSISYTAYVSYNAGVIKNYTPSGTPDARTPLVRNINAPQAADTNFASSAISLVGTYLIFFGDTSSTPANSAAVRALANNRFTNAGNTFNLNTGTTNLKFAIAMPATMSLTNVTDLDALNANITSSYVLATFNVNDAAGNPVSYKVYTMTNGAAYPANHRHQMTVA